MLRSVLVGVLAVTAFGCKSKSEPSAAQVSGAAGKVIDVSGAVTVRHGDAARPLAKGESVEGDDTIETGADGHVVIELAHNLAMWELGANKKQKVKDSLAWKLAKKEGSAAAVEQDTAAAGRHAERSAADTTVSSADKAAAPAEEAAPAAAAPAQAAPAAPMAPPAPVAAAPAPPPPPPPKERERMQAADDDAPPKTRSAAKRDSAPAPGGAANLEAAGGGGLGVSGTGAGGGGTGDGSIGTGTIGTLGKGAGTGAGPGYGAREDARVKALLVGKRDELASCAKDHPELITLIVTTTTDGTPTVSLVSRTKKVSAQIEACMKKIVATFDLPKVPARTSIRIEK